MLDETTLKRLRWHSRRGMWELDMLLVPFFDHCFDSLSDEEQHDYWQLLQGEDQELFMWLMRREPCVNPALQPMVDKITDFARDQHTTNVRPV